MKTKKKKGTRPSENGLIKAGDRLYSAQADAEEAVRTLLRWVGEDPDRSGLRDTPKRVVKALQEMCGGYSEDPKVILSRIFDDDYDEVVLLRQIPFTSLCEHHLLTFSGSVDIGYIPKKGKVVGLSKMARLVDCLSRRLQVQERLTKEIAQALLDHLESQGVAVVVRAAHSCMQCRGVKKPGTEMVTSCMLGAFRTEAQARAEFLSLCRD